MIDFTKATFIKSAPSLSLAPFDLKKEVVFVGKSNVGKSSLINALTHKKSLAFTSSKPGFTKLLNYFAIDDKFYLVDAPGYGYTASGSKHLDNFGKMMEEYFDNPHLKGVVFLVDSRHDLSNDDIDFYHYLVDKNIPYVLVFTKADKLNQSAKAKVSKRVKELEIDSYCLVSTLDNKSLDKLKAEIDKMIGGK